MWVFYSLFVAASTSVITPLTKKLTDRVNPIVILFVSNLLILPLMIALVFFLGGIPKLTTNFFIFIFISAVIDSLAFVTSIWGIKMSPVSLITPVTSFTPVFTTIIAFFMLHETPTPIKFLGIFIIVLGAYLLNIADIKHGLLKPFKKLFQEKGVQLVFLATFLWSITPIFQKKAIFETSPIMPFFPSVVNFALYTVFIAPFAITKIKKELPKVKKKMFLFSIFAPVAVLTQFAAYSAFSEVNVGYATAVFKLSVLLTIIWGGLFFKEERIKERLLGAIVMILGTILIIL